MVNQRRYKRGKKTNRRKTRRVKRSRVKRSRVKRTKMRGGGILQRFKNKIRGNNNNLSIASSQKSDFQKKYKSTTSSGRKSKTLRKR